MPYLSIHQFTWAFTTPITGLGTWQVLTGAQHTGLAEFGRIVGNANLIGATGGTLDVVLQTSYSGGVAGGWKDVARFNQLASGAAAISWVVPITRVGSGTTTAPVAVNTADLTPTISVNTISGQTLGDSLRVIVLPGAGTTAGALLTFSFDATP